MYNLAARACTETDSTHMLFGGILSYHMMDIPEKKLVLSNSMGW